MPSWYDQAMHRDVRLAADDRALLRQWALQPQDWALVVLERDAERRQNTRIWIDPHPPDLKAWERYWIRCRRGGKNMFVDIIVLSLAGLFTSAHSFAQEPGGLIARGKQLFIEQGCYGWHTVGKMGTPIAPDLSAVGSRYPESYLARWLRDPSAQKPTAHMPKLDLTDIRTIHTRRSSGGAVWRNNIALTWFCCT